MQQNQKISKSLIELSDAIEQLAMLIAEQNKTEQNEHIAQFSLVVQKFKETTQQIQPTSKNSEEQILQKYQKGFLEKWLIDKRIYVGKSSNTLQVDKKLYTIADYLSDHYHLLKDFYAQLKKSQNVKRDFKAKTTKQSISYIRKWCNMLHRNKIIDSFQFLNNQLIDIDIAEIHNATYFINGYWLEILLRNELAKILRKNIGKIISFDILAQVEIMKPNHKSSEVDLLLMLNQKVYWFECKSGDIGATYYKRFAEHRKRFHLPQEQSFLLVPAMQMHQAEAIKKRCGMQTLYATQIEQQLQQFLF